MKDEIDLLVEEALLSSQKEVSKLEQELQKNNEGEASKSTNGEIKIVKGCLGCVGYLIAGMLIATLAFITYIYLSSEWDLYAEKGKMALYLKEKYDKEFVVNEIHYEGKWGLDSPTVFIAEVHPVDDKELVFKMERTNRTSYYHEDYLNKYWRKQVQPIVDEYFNLHEIKISKAYANIFISNNVLETIKGETPTLDEAIAKYNKDVEYILDVEVKDEYHGQTRLKYASQIREILGFFKNHNHIENPNLAYCIHVEGNEGKKLSFRLHISSQNIKTIHTDEDVLSLIRENFKETK